MDKIPDKLHWPQLGLGADPQLVRFFAEFQEQLEGYLRIIQQGVLERANQDLGLQHRWKNASAGDTRVGYDDNGFLQFFVDDTKVAWFDWDGNWYRTVTFDAVTTDLSKTNDRQLFAYDPDTQTIDIFSAGAQVLSISSSEITVDNQYEFRTGRTLANQASTSWIDEDVNGTFLSVKEHRVLQITTGYVDIAGNVKLG